MKPGIVCTLRDQSPEEEDEETYRTYSNPLDAGEAVHRMRAEMQAKFQTDPKWAAEMRAEMAPDGLIIPPEEKSEADYRRRIAEGKVQVVGYRYVMTAAEMKAKFEEEEAWNTIL